MVKRVKTRFTAAPYRPCFTLYLFGRKGCRCNHWQVICKILAPAFWLRCKSLANYEPKFNILQKLHSARLVHHASYLSRVQLRQPSFQHLGFVRFPQVYFSPENGKKGQRRFWPRPKTFKLRKRLRHNSAARPSLLRPPALIPFPFALRGHPFWLSFLPFFLLKNRFQGRSAKGKSKK